MSCNRFRRGVKLGGDSGTIPTVRTLRKAAILISRRLRAWSTIQIKTNHFEVNPLFQLDHVRKENGSRSSAT